MKDLTAIVKKVLEEHKEARDSDSKLICWVYSITNPDIMGLSFSKVMWNSAYFDLPSFETIRRTRQKIQHDNPHLRGVMYEKRMAKQKDGNKSLYNTDKYSFLLDAPFVIGGECCRVMKKQPTKQYERQTGRVRITAMMAEESRVRTQQWLMRGCNGFEMKRPVSNPMSFWTEQDILQYIKENNLPICSVYGDIVPDYKGTDEFDGQLDFSDIGAMEDKRRLKTTGCSRTGCMFCGFGCHLESSPSRFERMKQTHPKQYEFIMKPIEKGGLGYKEVIEWLNEHGNLHIKY